jgi:hypothetical protein
LPRSILVLTRTDRVVVLSVSRCPLEGFRSLRRLHARAACCNPPAVGGPSPARSVRIVRSGRIGPGTALLREELVGRRFCVTTWRFRPRGRQCGRLNGELPCGTRRVPQAPCCSALIGSCAKTRCARC